MSVIVNVDTHVFTASLCIDTFYEATGRLLAQYPRINLCILFHFSCVSRTSDMDQGLGHTNILNPASCPFRGAIKKT